MAAKQLSKAERFYIDSMVGKMSESEIASELGINIRTLQAYLRKRSAEVPTTPPQKDKFIQRDGITIMTEAQSHDDDEKEVHKAGSTIPYEHMRKHIHVIDPSKPIS